MSKAVQAPVQDRYKAVQATTSAPVAVDPSLIGQPGHPEWKPRTDGKTARRISERATVFDEPSPALLPADPLAAIADPIWDHRQFRRWTPDLVHCRLLVCGRTIFKLPQTLRSGFVSQLGNVAISEIVAGRRIAATPAEITVLDWTWQRLIRPPELQTIQRILMASAFDRSLDDIAKVLSSSGIKISKATVGRWYHAEKLRMAADWQRTGHPVDDMTAETWGVLFNRATK